MFKKATKLLSTMVIVAGTVVGNFSPTLALAEGAVKAGDTEGMTNTVKVKDDSLADCKRILEGQATFPVQAGETEPVDLVVVEDASGSFSDNFPHVRQAIDEVVQGLSDQDRVMLASYRGGKQFMFPDGKTKINSADYDMNVRVNTQLTYDKSQFVSGFGDVRTYGGTPTAPGLKLALDTYNQTHGDLTNRKTYFLLVTDGVANTRLDGYLHKTNTNDSINEYPDPRHPLQVSVEYSNDYQGAAAEVLALNQEITNQGYEMINAYWESVESLSSVNSYFDKYKKEVGPFVKQELQQGSSTPEDFITSQSIDDFTTQLKQIVKDRLAQSTPATASLTIANQFDIQSATATDDAGNDVPVQINGQTISATSTDGYVGNITIHYEVKENTAIDAATLVSSGTMNQGTIAKEFPEATIPKNDNAHACDVTPEDPTITKDIENQEHLDLTNREDSFDWHVKTAFGNETSTWTQASMVDDINKVLDIIDVKVTDENGKDVTANGTVTQENNKVTFEMNKQADSYDYLSGHTYTMTITTKIKTDATDEELAPYIEQGGIPNQADLNFGNEGDVLHSNKPTVTPPAPTPEDPTITKDIENQEHLDLTNREDSFDWHVKTAFGNETSTWTQASMVDDINKVLDITDVKVTDENGKDVTANGKVTQENNKVTFEMNKKDDSYAYLSGHTYTMTITTKIKADATDEELAPYIEQGGIPNQADLNFGNEGDVLHSNKPTVTPPAPTPEDPTITKDIENQEHLDLTNREDSFDWHVKTAFGNETSTWTQASMVDDINKVLDIIDVKVTDENGKDVTANGTVTQENNKVTFEMNKQADSYDYLSGHTYTMTITTKIKTDATDEELAPYIEQGGIPNQADLNFGNEGDVLHSNKPTVTPPAPTPEDPTITKDIEGQEHLDLANRDQEFKWNVKTAFGNETSTWTQASMVDDINKVLDITDVKITDENGKDVTANGKVTQGNNKVTFEMNKKDDSYSYLAGHTYTMTITTKIKADATDEELAPYIEQGGIPNQADLNFGNEGDVLHSNKPTVTPPAPTPEDPTITKDIEGQEHLDLANRDQEFKWNVKTAFGNETSTWTQASMVDDINKVLDITDVKITDENGKDVTANGKVTQGNNKVTFEMNKKDDSYSYLAGHTYTMTITTKIKADATDEELAPYIEQGGIPNQADLNFGNEGDVLHSNKPTVTPPAPTPEDPTITKDIEGQEHLDLTNRDQAFKWNIKTAFGNETSTWTQASMVDDINKVLDITDVKVTDESGKDVTANGKVTQENNKVTFEMNKKDDSYSYLAGHTYTMTITTKIKADATDEELAPYIEQGGIPNQADLNFGNEGDVLHSNKPTVTPPAPTPEDPKKPEPKQPLKPKKPLTPTNHQAPTNPVNFGKSASKGIHLPMTNTTVNPLYLIAGLIVLIVAISFGITKNKKRKN
ncbi:isopeptide-forming domain-containing fimbrial protein [Enterococcus faecalis]|nr:isopeptide-forming domain-containing fimbrial protein [Enterococcus faecalis]